MLKVLKSGNWDRILVKLKAVAEEKTRKKESKIREGGAAMT